MHKVKLFNRTNSKICQTFWNSAMIKIQNTKLDNILVTPT